MRITLRLFKNLSPPPPVTHTLPRRLGYSLGLSYASKYSPPFYPTPKPSGFAGKPGKVGRWVDGMMGLRAGRGELRASSSDGVGEREGEGEGEGGWSGSMQDEVKKWGAGEDFFAVHESGAFTHLAVSDGVGGWSSMLDPSLYAQSLMFHYAQHVTSAPSSTPWAALEKAYAGVEADEGVLAGSATAVGIALSDTGKARGINLGDSGFSILRQDKLAFSSSSQTHYFNCPLQLSKYPPGYERPPVLDTPDRGEKFEFDVEPGDVVILYTDGLCDNLPLSFIPALDAHLDRLLTSESNAHLSRTDRAAERARLLADVLIAYARVGMCMTGEEGKAGKDGESGKAGWTTPFEEEARRAGQRDKGGKVDDVTVLLAVVSEQL